MVPEAPPPRGTPSKVERQRQSPVSTVDHIVHTHRKVISSKAHGCRREQYRELTDRTCYHVMESFCDSKNAKEIPIWTFLFFDYKKTKSPSKTSVFTSK